ncbi:M1-specific T cell receptor alpha chain-like [Zootoca vivipara]|uniref:M1-specific T cell receptor alpha chain-like n=1 Tax=Zootoca vivipara TaxID=8524 RepID=UPI00293C0FB6|nr:M1-specific T cell receptor alpha chain-like [Zootoca vivipara]
MSSRVHLAQWRILLGLFWLCGDISGDASQLSEVYFSSGETARISCKHGLSSYTVVFWYKQTQDTAPSSVIHGYSKKEKKERLEMDTDKGNLSTELSISKVEMGDAGIYHCAASDTVEESALVRASAFFRMTPRVHPAQWILFGLFLLCRDISGDASQLSEVSFSFGETARIFCKHGVSAYNGVFWYKQTQDAAPSLVIYSYSKMEKKERLEMDTDKGNLSTELSISKVEMGDAGIYHCAASDTVVGNASFGKAPFHCAGTASYGKLVFGQGTSLTIQPDLKTSEPSIYKLQPSKEGDRDISACLITDYFPAPITVGADINNSEKVNGSVVVVKENGKETPSYGTVVWGKGKKAGDCYAEYNNTRFQPESAEAATTCSEKTTGGFETDERLNLLSLTVLGLRVIFLKCVAFNLLFTFHAWSS